MNQNHRYIDNLQLTTDYFFFLNVDNHNPNYYFLPLINDHYLFSKEIMSKTQQIMHYFYLLIITSYLDYSSYY